MSTLVEEHGWTAVPRSLSTLIASRQNPQASRPIKCDDITLPDTPLVKAVMKYAQEKLPIETFHHSMRVFYYAEAIRTQHFPTWSLSSETLLLTSLLHDIGTIPSNQDRTFLSFEFQGAIIAHNLVLHDLHAPVTQAEAVCETIIRHQDLGETGNVSVLTALIHFATVLDNAGLHAELVHAETIQSVVGTWPRRGWTGWFAAVVRRECEGKPWANTTRIEGFAEMVEGNAVMRGFDRAATVVVVPYFLVVCSFPHAHI